MNQSHIFTNKQIKNNSKQSTQLIHNVIDYQQQYKTLFYDWHNPLCNYAYRIVKDRNAAADIVQDVFVYLWEKRNDLDLTANIKSYLFQTTYHRSINYLKKSKVIPLSEEQYKMASQSEADSRFDQEADAFAKKEQIFKSLRHLPPKCREVFVLSRQNGLTYTEIADNLGISKKTVENHMVKALSIIRSHLNKLAKV